MLEICVYVYIILQRKQKEVAKENEFYMQLIQQALPAEAPSIASVCATDKEKGSLFYVLNLNYIVLQIYFYFSVLSFFSCSSGQ